MDDSELPQCTFAALRPVSPDILSCFDTGLKAKRRRHLHARGAKSSDALSSRCSAPPPLGRLRESVAGRANAAHRTPARYRGRCGISGPRRGVPAGGIMAFGRSSEMADQWLFKSETYDNCNCAMNCGCQFNLPSTHGYCQSAFVGNIVEGHFNDTPLAGLNWAALYKWPGEIKDGNGWRQIVIDERADEAQRIALETIISGEACAP
jgi:Protein of unknown function (DUF1326)